MAMIQSTYNTEVKILTSASAIAFFGFILSVAIAAVMYISGIQSPKGYNMTSMAVPYLISILYLRANGMSWVLSKPNENEMVDYRSFVLTLLFALVFFINTYSETINAFFRSPSVEEFINQHGILSAIHYNVLSMATFLLFLWTSFLSNLLSKKR